MSSVIIQEQRGGASGQPLLLLSAETLAEHLGFSARTIWRLRSAGKLPQPVRIGGSVRWRAEDIEAWIRAGCPEIETRGADRHGTSRRPWRGSTTPE